VEHSPIPKNPMRRREFTLGSAMALLSGVALSLSACSDEGAPDPTTGPAPASADRAAAISNNHGHAAVVTGAWLTAGRDLVVDIRGASNHSHTVSLTRSDLEAIVAGRQVVKSSSTDQSHDHTVTFN